MRFTIYLWYSYKNEVTYLGIKIVKDEERRCELNFSPVIDKTKKKFNWWLLRDLSLRGEY